MWNLFAMFSGPITGLIEKAILSGVMYAAGKGYVSSGDVTGIAAALFTIFSAVFTGVTKSEANKITAINDAPNGVVVVPTTKARTAGITPATGAVEPGGAG